MANIERTGTSRKKDGVETGELALDGKGRVRLRKASPRSWTRAKERQFLVSLAETCNVKWSAKDAGVSPQRAYERRRTNASFRRAWGEAVSEAYARLELVLLDRALNGTYKIVRRRDGSEERMLEYSNQVALTLLKMHRETAIEADDQPPPEDVEELRQRIENKLERIRKQDEERRDGAD